jgi:protein-S-isoprenylcysteine O-methyltransferase Ste14
MSNPPATQATGEEKFPSVSRSPRKVSLLARVLVRMFLALAISPAILFLPAGTWKFWQAWVLLAVWLIPVFSLFLYFLKRDPQLIERRMQHKEKETEQKRLIHWLLPLFLIAFLLPGFDHRFGWSRALLGAVPLGLTAFAEAMVLAGFLSLFWVFEVNRFAARTIRVEAGQTVVSTGPYRFVRHPMYSASILLWLFSPLALGSWVALPAFALLVPFYVLRILNEEKVLRAELSGYSEYCDRTRYRLLPFVW